MEKNNIADLLSLDSLFTTQAERDGAKGTLATSSQLLNIPLDVLDPWTDENGNPQPFRAYTPAQMADLAENIRQNGVITAIRVRPRNGRYQIIAGHNRVEAAKMAGLSVIPAIVEDLDDNQAVIVLVDSNLKQRERILPSEKAFAYKEKMKALNRQGQRTDLTSPQCAAKFRSDDEVAKGEGVSGDTIRRYIRLTELVPPLLERVDTGKLGMTPAVELSYQPKESQTQLSLILSETNSRVSKGAACQLRAESGELTAERIRAILGLNEKASAPKKLLKLDLSGFSSAQLSRIQTDAGLQDWLLQQLNCYLDGAVTDQPSKDTDTQAKLR